MSQELKIIDQTYELLFWLRQKVVNFPRHSKYSLGTRMESRLLDFLESLIDAKFSESKQDLLRKALVQLEQFRWLLRLAVDGRLVSIKAHQFAVRTMTELSKQLHGWRRHVDARQ